MMTKLHFMAIAAIGVVGLAACSQMAAPKKVTKPELPSERMAELSDEKLSTLQAGYGVYTTQCFQCHTQPEMTKYSESQWSAITPSMATHAGITNTESDQVLAYILARKKLRGH